MVFELLHSVHLASAHTQKLDGGNSLCGPEGNNCSGVKAHHGPIARSTQDTKYYKGFLASPQHQSEVAAKQAKQVASGHIDRHFDGRDYTGVSSKSQIAAARAQASHPLVDLVHHHTASDASYSTKNSGIASMMNVAHPHQVVSIDSTGMGGPLSAATQAATNGTFLSHPSASSSGTLASTDWSGATFSGEVDGYPALNPKKVNSGNRALYLLMKGSHQQGANDGWAMDANNARLFREGPMPGPDWSFGGRFKCPGASCNYAPDPATQWQNPTYSSK